MRHGHDLLIACPHCGKEYLQKTLVSGNNIGARYWTDGKRDALGLPALPSLTRCCGCNAFFHVDDAEVLADERQLFFSGSFSDDENGEDSTESKENPASGPEWEEKKLLTLYRTAQYIRFLTLNELSECIDMQPEAIQERERQIAARTELLHKKNDYYRYSTPSFDSDMNDTRIVSNMETLVDILSTITDDENAGTMMLRAELLRELGRFKEAEEALNAIPGEARPIPLFETMASLIRQGDSRIYEYNGETGRLLSPEEFRSTALLHACRSGDPDMVSFFSRKAGQEELNEAVRSLDIYEETAFPVLRILLRHGADISSHNEGGRTLLHDAIEEGEYSAAKKLLEMGIKPDKADGYGNTPMILTAESFEEQPELITELLQRGADVNRQNSRGETAYSAAKSREYKQIMSILAKAGADTTLGPEKEDEESHGMRWL